MYSLHHFRRCAAALLFLLATTHRAAGQDVIIRVPVEPNGTAARVTLPFGEPFLLVGGAPETLRKVDVRYDEYLSIPPTTEDCSKLFDTRDTTVLAWTRAGAAKPDTFAVHLLEGLSANRRYGLCLRTQSRFAGTELQAFQDSAYRILENKFAALDSAGEPPKSLEPADIRELQLAMAEALPRAPGQTLNPGKTIFNTDISATDEAILVWVADVLTARNRRHAAVRSWNSADSTVTLGIEDLADRPAVKRIAGRLRPTDRVAGMDSTTVERALGTARLLASMDERLLGAALSGESVFSATALVPAQPVPPRRVTDPADVSARMARLDTTYLRLTEVRDLVAGVAASPNLQARAGIGATDADSLRAEIDLVREQFSGVRQAAARWATADSDRRRLLRGAAASLRVLAENDVTLVATSISNFETRAKQYVTADIGVVYAPLLGQAAPYFGANFYLSAINKRVPMALIRNEMAHWSATVGLTATSLKQEGERDDLFSSYSLLLGAGRRITDALRVTGGGIVFRDRDDNPLVDHSSIALSPFVSLSFDFDARAALGRVGEILSK